MKFVSSPSVSSFDRSFFPAVKLILVFKGFSYELLRIYCPEN